MESSTSASAGIKMIMKLYGVIKLTLSSPRYIKFKQMLAEKSKFEPQNLPATGRAIFYQSLQVHFKYLCGQN